MSKEAHYDVAIVGGGPAGSTVGGLLKKYAPDLRVAILERETFPRDHIGESLLPPCCAVLNELGCWDEVEAADFPIKIGATYRWGKNPELWDFEFLPSENFVDEARPARYEGQRTKTAFQVDRARYDEILLDHAARLGCEVRQNTKVAKVHREGNRIASLETEEGDLVRATHYVDASGNAGLLRRAFNIHCDTPSTLRNIAIWDYWQNTDWAVEIGVGGTRIQVLSLGWGWLWFIPMGPTRTSIGLVVPADHYKKSGKRPAELYEQALSEEPIVRDLIKNATSEGKLGTTKDWSFLARKHYGDNWFLVGECAGFADPILSAGVSMAQVGAQQLAYTILETERGSHDPKWLKGEFENRQKSKIATHIRFGDYWYTANAQFTDLQEFTSKLAENAGLELTPQKAWAWIAQGGFIGEEMDIGIGGFCFNSVVQSGDFLTDIAFQHEIERCNVFRLNLAGASWKETAVYREGRVYKAPCYVREGRVLPVYGQIELVVNLLQRDPRFPAIMMMLEEACKAQPEIRPLAPYVTEALEAMIRDGWIDASFDPDLPQCSLVSEFPMFKANTDPQPVR